MRSNFPTKSAAVLRDRTACPVVEIVARRTIARFSSPNQFLDERSVAIDLYGSSITGVQFGVSIDSDQMIKRSNEVGGTDGAFGRPFAV